VEIALNQPYYNHVAGFVIQVIQHRDPPGDEPYQCYQMLVRADGQSEWHVKGAANTLGGAEQLVERFLSLERPV
jgi:hypothetical protein